MTQTVGKKIRLLRHQKGWNQQDMAKRLAISTPAYSKIETGVTDVNLSRLEQISTLFEMSVVQLIAYNEIDQQLPSSSNREELIEKIHDREEDIIELQKKVISLYDELRHSQR